MILSPVVGFMLLPRLGDEVYLGVDRTPFEPDLRPEDADLPGGPRGSTSVSAFVAPGWRRSLYELVEHNANEETPFLLTDLNVARAAHDALEEHVGPHDLVWTAIWLPERPAEAAAPQGWRFLGYDLAYLGGDFYSAVKNGLLLNPDPLLVKWHRQDLSEAGLFRSRDSLSVYLDRFREFVRTESASVFYVYQLHLWEPR